MKICGWKDLKTMAKYTSLSAIEVLGATRSIKVIPPNEVTGRAVELFGQSGQLEGK